MIDAKTCLVWSKTVQYRYRLQKTIKNIKASLEIAKCPYIAFSCGKDSSVLADIVLSLDPSVPLRFISSGETRIVHNVDDVIQYFKGKHDAQIEEIVFDRVFAPEWSGATFDEQRKAGRRDIQNIDNQAYDGVYMGLRKEESRGRRLSLIVHSTKDLPDYVHKYTGRNFYRMCPLADWTTVDIGAYLCTHKIPVLDWYTEYGFDSRTTARLTGDAIRQNVIFYLHKHNPAGYQTLIKRFPELKIY